MEIGIVGLPGVGKSSLFKALTGVDTPVGGAFKPAVALAAIPDPRLHTIAGFIPTKKIIPAQIQFVDIPGVAPGGGGDGASRLNSFLVHVRQVDAICHVIRCFEDDIHGPARAAADGETMETELILADMQVAESAIDKATRNARSGDKDAKHRLGVLERCLEAGNDGRAIRSIPDWTEADQGVLRGYGMITAKPVLYVANVGEDGLTGEDPQVKAVMAHAAANQSEAVVLCAKLEAELSELEGDDQKELLEAMGLSEPAIGPLARAANAVLGLSTFYTAGDKEVRAWVIPVAATAPEAAGAIHSDIQRGFIRAECYHIDDLVAHKTEKAIRDAGKLRSEGKQYVMRDGDVVHFRFNV
ncbi:MAG: redox-regulated ATPase YchF [Phycisphaerales bacterium]|nr:redox-regulated ATPase YchF [Phycisphaerales bacterium]